MQVKIEHIGHGDTMIDDLALGKRILDVLEKHYAYHAWFVDTNHQSGHASIQLMYEGPDKQMRIWKYGYLLHTNKLEGNDFEHKIMMAGGEVLERYNMARREFLVACC